MVSRSTPVWLPALCLAQALWGCGAGPGDSAADGGSSTDDGGALADGGTACTSGSLAITWDNLTPCDSIHHPLALLAGSAETDATDISVTSGQQTTVWPISQGRFTALVRLQPGDNLITLEAGADATTLLLHHEPQSNPRFVRLVYVVASDGDGTFQAAAGEPNGQASARSRLALAGEMMQTYLAESMQREGFGRRTFRLLRGTDGSAEVLVHQTSLTTEQALSMDGVDLWSHFYGELSSLPDREHSIDLAIMAFSRYDPETQTLRGHTALGGGRLALFGSTSLHTWPDSLAQVPDRLLDETVIDGNELHDDSAGRQRAWANYATGFGASTHELGHCLSLPHPATGSTIMSRGFDHINRWFASREPPSAIGAGLDSIVAADQPGWHDGNAARLGYHRHLDLVNIAYPSNTPPAFERTAQTITVTSATGLRQVEYRASGNIVDFRHFESAAAAEHVVNLDEMRSMYGSGTNFRVTAIDADGNIGESDEQPL